MRSTPPLGGLASDRRPAVSAFARVTCPSARLIRPLGIAALLLFGTEFVVMPLAAAPNAAPGGPYTLTISGSVMLRGDNSTASSGSITGYAWDIDGDGDFGDLSGDTPVLTWSQFPLAVGPHAVALRVTDSGGQTQTASATVDVVSSPLIIHDQLIYGGSAPVPGQDGRLYGVIYYHPITSEAVWRVDQNGTGYALLHQFIPSDINEGSEISGPPLRGADGVLYGTMLSEGPRRAGTLWRLNSDGTGSALLWAFQEVPDGWFPAVPVFGPNGMLYGTAAGGGPDIMGYGTIWRFNMSGSSFSALHYFDPLVDGRNPYSPVFGLDGRLYGLTQDDTLWRINADGTGFTVVRAFAPDEVAANATGIVAGAEGKLYGASGTVVWRINVDGTDLQTLASSVTAMSVPTIGPDGRLYGASPEDGAFNSGLLWRMNADGSELVYLHHFNPAMEPSHPSGPPRFASDGRLWGMVSSGGTEGLGALYAWSPNPTLQSFGNGSFESGFTGWLAAGNQRLSSAAGHATDGTRAVVFNAGNTAPNGSVSKTFATLAGQAYMLRFDAGVLAFNRNTQRLEVIARGDGPLLSQVISITGLGGGAIRWASQTITFLADSTATTLVFRDISSTTNGLDLLLDHVRLEAVAAPSLTNGSFESGYTGWSASGHQTVATNATQATDGTKFVVFNNGNTAPNGVLAQSFATTPGQLCTLRFDVGVIAYNQNVQRLQVTATGNSALWSQVIAVTGAGGGTVRWTPQTHSFIPDSATTTLTFRDVSTTTSALDLLLDHVRIE